MGRLRVSGNGKKIMAVVAIVLVLAVAFIGVRMIEGRMNPEIANAGEQMTSHTAAQNTAQVFMHNRWYAERNVETLLVMGIDDLGPLDTSEAYTNHHQTDFLVLFLRDLDTGKTAAIHINRDTMTDITTLGVTGQPTGSIKAQLALAYNYGSGDHISSQNTVDAVERLLYGMQVDHYITVTMDAVPILNDWAGGVTLSLLDDFTAHDPTMVQGKLMRLNGSQALTYVRSRGGLADSTNLHRMERQRQYASEWVGCAQNRLSDEQAVADLVLKLDGVYRSDCTVDDLSSFGQSLSMNPSMPVYELEGEAVRGDVYMEYYVDEEKLQQLVLELFYAPVGD